MLCFRSFGGSTDPTVPFPSFLKTDAGVFSRCWFVGLPPASCDKKEQMNRSLALGHATCSSKQYKATLNWFPQRWGQLAEAQGCTSRPRCSLLYLALRQTEFGAKPNYRLLGKMSHHELFVHMAEKIWRRNQAKDQLAEVIRVRRHNGGIILWRMFWHFGRPSYESTPLLGNLLTEAGRQTAVWLCN